MKLHRIAIALLGLLVLATAACGTDRLLDPGAPQGIDGLALLGPRCPVQTAEDPCPDTPFQARIAVRADDGTLVTRVRSGEDGRFRVGLRPGSYVLDPEPGDPLPLATQVEVEVEEGVWAEVTILFDTGIR